MTACAGKYKPDFCDIINTNKLACRPTDTSKDDYDLPIIKALGYRCLSPKDWREGKKRAREILEIDSNFFPMVMGHAQKRQSDSNDE